MPRRLTLLIAAAVLVSGCSAVLSLGDFTFDATDGGVTDASNDTTGDVDQSDGCAVDLTKQCYACTPTTTEQFLNSCADGTQCLSFDRSRLTALLLPDGALPPLPIADAGGQ